ncbi:MAG: histidine phosphatase family protein [Actinomycetota bacterium]
MLSSPLRRARETAEPLAHVLGLQIEVDDRLAERMNWDGETDFDAFVRGWQQATADRDYLPRVGDSSRAAGARSWKRSVNGAGEKRRPVIAVAHGGVTVDLLRTILGDATVEECWPTLLNDGAPGCALRRLIYRNDGFVVESVADVGHL